MATNTWTLWQKKVVRAIKADPKKATALAVLVAVMVGMWAKALSGFGGPDNASASAHHARPVIDLTTGGPVNFGGGAGGGNESWQQLLEWARQPITPVTRNLFSYD